MKQPFLKALLPTAMILSGCNAQISANIDGEGSVTPGGGGGPTPETVDLSLRLEGNASGLNTGDTVLYTLVINNNSQSVTAKDVVANIPIPDKLKYTGNDALCKIKPVGSIDTVVCGFGDVEANGKEQVFLPFEALATGEARVTATVLSAQIDNNRDNNSETLAITVEGCDPCKSNAKLALSWNPNTDAILGYNVYYGPTESSTDQFYGRFDPSTDPQVNMNAWQDLRLTVGQSICFRVTAFNSLGESTKSDAVCGQAS